MRDIILPTTKPDEWPALREEIRQRILATLGTAPDLPLIPAPESLGYEEVDGIQIERIRIEIIPGIVTYGAILTPAILTSSAPGAICIHGTDHDLAHRNQFSPTKRPNRAYALELAQRGYVTISLDQPGFGEGNDGKTEAELRQELALAYPAWSTDGARLAVQQAALTLLERNEAVDATRLACMGNSLGGRAAIYLAALDERIQAAVVSTGISPNASNLFRNLPGPEGLSPALAEMFCQSGHPPFEYHEMLALIAPRHVLLLEPWNDTCNPSIDPVLDSFTTARHVFQLLTADDRLQILCHGDGHDTRPHVRSYAYDWMENALGQIDPGRDVSTN